MNGDMELLNYVYQNSQMGVDTLGKILPMMDEGTFKIQLSDQKKEYERFHRQAKEQLNKSGCDEKGINAMEKIMTYLMIDMKMMMNSTQSRVAEMLIKGSNMGIVDAQKKIHQYENKAGKEALKLMESLMEFEEKNVEQLKAYL